MSNTFVVLKKEYFQIVKSLSFWISTIFFPLFMAGIIFIPMILVSKQKASFTVYFKDKSNKVFPFISKADEEIGFKEIKLVIKDGKDLKIEDLKKKVELKEADGLVLIPEDPFKEKNLIFYGRNVSNFALLRKIEVLVNHGLLKKISEELKLSEDQIKKITHRLEVEGIKIEKGKEKKEGALKSFFSVFILFMILYTAIIGYGTHILRAVIEEKNTRVVELIVSSVSPFNLMMGKIFGVALAGITQILIWAFIFLFFSFGASQGFFAQSLPSYNFTQILFFGIFFILGYLLYSSLYAAIGSLFSSEQEAQQFSMIVVLPLILPVILMQMIMQNPNSTISVIFSLIPFFTPLLFYLRMLVEMPPLWQIFLSITLTSLTLIFIIYASGKIYRIGILMYGKKPTIREIIKWVKT